MPCSVADTLTILMVVGGETSSADHPDVELIDLTGEGRACRKPDDFPGALKGSSGVYFEENALVCGGYGPSFSSECFYYNPNGTWTQGPSMTANRSYATTLLHNNQLWIIGGDNSDVQGLDTTDLFNRNSKSFISSVDIPAERFGHSIISLQNNENEIMLLGGQYSYKKTYLYDGKWRKGPMLSRGRAKSQAGLVTLKNKTRIILAAGGEDEQTTEFLIGGDDQWQDGPDLPHKIFGGASVQLPYTYLIVGGKTNDSAYLDTIWTFDVETDNWTLLKEHLTTARAYTAAFLLPDNFC